MSDRERRDSERVDLLGALQGDVMVYQPSEIRQLSRGGMLVETRFPLVLDSLHDFRISLGGKSIIAKGRVAHSKIIDVDQDIVTYQTGIEFVALSDGVSAVIAAFLDTLRSGRA